MSYFPANEEIDATSIITTVLKHVKPVCSEKAYRDYNMLLYVRVYA